MRGSEIWIPLVLAPRLGFPREGIRETLDAVSCTRFYFSAFGSWFPPVFFPFFPFFPIGGMIDIDCCC